MQTRSTKKLSQEPSASDDGFAYVRIQGLDYEVFLLIGIAVGWDHFYSWRTVAALQKGEEVWWKNMCLGKTHWRAMSNSMQHLREQDFYVHMPSIEDVRRCPSQ